MRARVVSETQRFEDTYKLLAAQMRLALLFPTYLQRLLPLMMCGNPLRGKSGRHFPLAATDIQ